MFLSKFSTSRHCKICHPKIFQHNGRVVSRRTKIALFVAAASLFFGVAMEPARAESFECAKLSDLNTPKAAAEIDTLLPPAQELAQPAELGSAIELMREHGLSTDNTINHLIAMYCPNVASRTDLSTSEKSELVRKFASEATRLVFANNTIEDVIFNVPLSPMLAEEAKTKADQAGLTVEQWIARSVATSVR
jgi:hypothetical protein